MTEYQDLGSESRSSHEGAEGAAPAREVSSESLLGDARELHILHQGARYTLRRTGKGGLILTK